MDVKQKQIFTASRRNLLVVFGFAVANIVCSVFNLDIFFQFGFTLPLFISQIFYYLGTATYLLIGILINAILSGAFMICRVFSKDMKYGYLVAAEVIYFIDSLSVLFMMFYSGEYLFYVVNICFHLFIIISLHQSALICYKEGKEPTATVADVNVSELN